jgi:hypothetical protein
VSLPEPWAANIGNADLSGGPHAIFSHPRSNVAGVHYRSAEGVLRKADIPQRLRITKDVSVLRANHFKNQAILSGVWEVVEASTGVTLRNRRQSAWAWGSLAYLVRIGGFHSECFATIQAKKAHLFLSLRVEQD